MKKYILSICAVLLSFTICNAQTVSEIMNKVLNTFNTSKTMSADFSIVSPDFNLNGTIVMNGKKFKIQSKDYICWYDGVTQWIYTTVTDEVNILEPSKEELESNNPYLAIMRYNTKYRPSLVSQTDSFYEVQLTSRNPYVDMSNICITIDKKSYKIIKAVITMIDDSTQTVNFGNYKEENLPTSIFVFDNKLVPEGTPIIDLR